MNLPSKQHHDYFEAIIQLRDGSEEMEDFSREELRKAKVNISKTVQVKNGVDLYVADARVAKLLGRKLQSKYGGHFLVTASLFSRKDGRNIYRVTVLFRQAGFKKGDTVSYKGDTYLVLLMDKKITLRNLANGQRRMLRYSEIESIKKIVFV